MRFDWKKLVAIVCAVLFSLGVFFILLFNAVDTIAFDLDRYEEAYEKYDRPEFIGISMEELMEVTENMLDYLKGKRENLVMQANIKGAVRDVFGEREIAHMIDVEVLFSKGITLRYVMYGVVVLAFVGMALMGKMRSIKVWPVCWYSVLGVLGAAGLAYGIWCMVDFTSAFTAFHHLLFTNDLWILDPSYEVLIQMFPEEFFYSTALAIFKQFGLHILLITGLAVCASIWLHKTAKEEENGAAES